MTSFLTWWFDTHWIWATVLTPFTTFLWAIYTNSVAWTFGCIGALAGREVFRAFLKRLSE